MFSEIVEFIKWLYIGKDTTPPFHESCFRGNEENASWNT